MRQTLLLIGENRPDLRAVLPLLDSLPVRVLRAGSGPADGPEAAAAPDLILFSLPSWDEAAGLPADVRRALTGFPDVPALAVGPDSAQRHLGPGTRVAFLPADLPSREKLRTLRRLLGLSPSGPLKVGPLTLCPDTREAHYRAARLSLTETEFEVLRALMERPGEAARAADLATRVGSHAVVTHVRRLRRKLAAHGASALLRGDARRGYCVDARQAERRAVNPGTALRLRLLRL